MNYKDLLDKQKIELDDTVDFYKSNISSIRTGRATSAILDDVVVEAYDSKFKIQELATISVPEPRSLIIQPWDKQTIPFIEKAITSSDLGLSPIVDGQQIRLNFPPLTEERRREFIKVLNKKTEETRVRIRQVREHIWSEVQKLEKEGEIREDDKFRAKDDIQEMVEEYNKKIEDLEKNKEEELLTS